MHKRPASSPLPSAPPSATSSEPRLPLLVLIHLLGWVPKGDRAAHLLLSKDVRQALLVAMRTLKLPYGRRGELDPNALMRLLPQTTGLKQLDTGRATNELKLQVIRALGNSSLGGGAGLLPRLTQLQVGSSTWTGASVGNALADALEARRALGLSPVTSVKSSYGISPGAMHRIWSCCPPEKTTHLQSHGAQLQTLGNYMNGGAVLSALRWLTASGRVQEGTEPEQYTTQILRALAQGRTPNLRGLYLSNWERVPMTLLGEAFRKSKLPKLSFLSLTDCEFSSEEDFRAIVVGLSAAKVPLRRLSLVDIMLSDIAVQHLARALKAGGGLRKLRELNLSYEEDVGAKADPILGGLVGRAPCAKTLKDLNLSGRASKAPVLAFFSALGRGHFPLLSNLCLYGDGIGDEMMGKLAEALLALLAKGTPSPLSDVTLNDDALTVACFDALTAVFEVGGLPDLRELSVYGLGETDTAAVGFVEAWTALGPAIKLKYLDFNMPMPAGLTSRLLDAAADPAFCPPLSYAFDIPGIEDEDVEARFKERRNT